MNVNAITVASKLDWGGWVKGLIGAVISGGAGAVGSGISVTVLDKTHDINTLEVMGLTFLVSGAVSLAKYLQQHPVPDDIPPTPQKETA